MVKSLEPTSTLQCWDSGRFRCSGRVLQYTIFIVKLILRYLPEHLNRIPPSRPHFQMISEYELRKGGSVNPQLTGRVLPGEIAEYFTLDRGDMFFYFVTSGKLD